MKLKDTIHPKNVMEFVLNAHGDFDAVQKLAEDDPRLVNATADMGNGDWESALDAAAHMGLKDVARYLIEKGARLDMLYLAAMLDEVEIVRAILEAFPSARHTKGVHGFPLRFFAERGKAEKVLAYLDSLGD